jgi:hypothetical protein
MYKKIFLIILLFKSPMVFGWSFIDKALYDNYRNCLNNKLKDVDRRKTDINIARNVFEDECKKAFCTESTIVINEKYESCITDLRERCKAYDESKGYVFGCSEAVTCPKYKYEDRTCPSYRSP